jgi:hypothetical protein
MCIYAKIRTTYNKYHFASQMPLQQGRIISFTSNSNRVMSIDLSWMVLMLDKNIRYLQNYALIIFAIISLVQDENKRVNEKIEGKERSEVCVYLQ